MQAEQEQEPSESSTNRGDDCRNTIEGEASLVNPPMIRKLEHLTVTDNLPIQQRPSRASPDHHHLDRISPTHRGMLTPDGSRRSPADGSSPSTSQVSVGSVGPTLVAAAMLPSSKHFDLTPITRNTSREVYVEDQVLMEQDKAAVVSPADDLAELHGEHLAMPSDLAGPAMPPLQPERRRSAGVLDHELLQRHDALYSQHPQNSNTDMLESPPNLEEPVQFPPRKFYTFTSREQYEEEIQRESPQGGAAQQHQAATSPVGLTPYQPSRDDDLEGVGILPEEAVRSIFTRRPSSGDSSSSGESHANHRLVLQNPFPLSERQGSIPSIHLANHLQGSITSYTDHTENTEDEDSLLYIRGGDDDASLSSRGSSLYLPDQDKEGPPPSLLALQPSSRGGVVVEELTRVIGESSKKAPKSSDEDESSEHARRKRKHLKKAKRQQRAMDWLHSLEANELEVAEAASSRFLTGRASPSAILSDRGEPQTRRQTMPTAFHAPPIRDDGAGERQPGPFPPR